MSHGLQLQPLWRIATAAVGLHVFGRAAVYTGSFRSDPYDPRGAKVKHAQPKR